MSTPAPSVTRRLLLTDPFSVTFHLKLSASTHGGVERAFDALVRDLAEVLEARLRAGRRRELTLNERVLRGLVVVRQLERDAAVENAEVEPALVFRGQLGLELVVPDVRAELQRADVADFAPNADGLVERHGVPESGALTRLADRPAQPERADGIDLREPRLVADHPREARRRIVHQLEVLAERAVVVTTHRGGEIQAVAPRQLLLQVPAERDDVAVLLRGGESGRRTCNRARSGSEAFTRCLRSVHRLLVVLRADGRRRGIEPSM